MNKKIILPIILILLTISISLVSASDNLIVTVPTKTSFYSLCGVFGGTGDPSIVGESLVNSTHANNITSVKFFLQKSGTPLADLFVYIGGSNGTVGTDGSFNGSILAISQPISAKSLTTSYVWYEFLFPQGCLIGINQSFVIMIGGSYGTLNALNYVNVGLNTTSTISFGNAFQFLWGTSGWQKYTYDLSFYIYGKVPSLSDYAVGWNDGVASVTPSPIPEETTTQEFGDGLIIGIIIAIAISLLLAVALLGKKKW